MPDLPIESIPLPAFVVERGVIVTCNAAAQRLMSAIETVTASGLRTPDLQGTATTAEVTRAVCAAVSR